jgi:hypothetical protein
MDCIEPVYTAFLRGGPGLDGVFPIYYNNMKHYILYKNVMILTQYVNLSRDYWNLHGPGTPFQLQLPNIGLIPNN